MHPIQKYLVEGILVQSSPEQCREVMSSFATNTLERLLACRTGKEVRLVCAPPVELSIGGHRTVTNYSAFVESDEMAGVLMPRLISCRSARQIGKSIESEFTQFTGLIRDGNSYRGAIQLC